VMLAKGGNSFPPSERGRLVVPRLFPAPLPFIRRRLNTRKLCKSYLMVIDSESCSFSAAFFFFLRRRLFSRTRASLRPRDLEDLCPCSGFFLPFFRNRLPAGFCNLRSLFHIIPYPQFLPGRVGFYCESLRNPDV